MDRTFVDSGALIALMAETDKAHAKAEAVYAELLVGRVQLITTNHIVDETCTWLLRHGRMQHKSALAFGAFISRNASAVPLLAMLIDAPSQKGMLVIYSNPDIERAAWEIFARYDTAGFSFTDCVSFAVMQALSIKKAFAFDQHFEMMGFELC